MRSSEEQLVTELLEVSDKHREQRAGKTHLNNPGINYEVMEDILEI